MLIWFTIIADNGSVSTPAQQTRTWPYFEASDQLLYVFCHSGLRTCRIIHHVLITESYSDFWPVLVQQTL